MYFSEPAVSHICSFVEMLLYLTIFEQKSTPIEFSTESLNGLPIILSIMLVLPTFELPMNIILCRNAEGLSIESSMESSIIFGKKYIIYLCFLLKKKKLNIKEKFY